MGRFGSCWRDERSESYPVSGPRRFYSEDDGEEKLPGGFGAGVEEVGTSSTLKMNPQDSHL